MKPAERLSRRQRALDVLLALILYILLARAGQLFAPYPGAITPIWFPSGILLALVVIRGRHLILGVFLGALLSTGESLFNPDSLAQSGLGIVAGAMNGLGDALGVYIGAVSLGAVGGIAAVFRNLQAFRRFFVLAVVAGPGVSAVLGIAGLWLAGAYSIQSIPGALAAWWIGDAVAVLLLTPLLLSYAIAPKELPQAVAAWPERLLLICLLVALPVVHLLPAELNLRFESSSLTFPLLLWVLLRGGLRAALWAVLYIVVVELALLLFSNQLGISPGSGSILTVQVLVMIRVAALFMVGTLIWQQRTDIETAVEEATHDALTGLWNRRSFMPRLEEELSRHARYGSALTLLMFDVDRFKSVNDTYGHATGDRVLCDLSRLAERDLRESDVLARWGGEEFVVMLPGTDMQGAITRGERLRALVESQLLAVQRSVTISLGVAEAREGVTAKQLLARADEALLKAKETGRNRLCVDSGS